MLKSDNDKKLILLLFTIIILIFTLLISHYTNKKRKIRIYNITRLTDEYIKNKERNKESQKEYVPTNKSNINSNSNKVRNIDNDNIVEDVILNIQELINNNQFDELLSLYNKEYVEYFNINTELLKDKFKFCDKVVAKITKIKHDDVDKDRVVVTVRLMDEKNGERMFDFTLFADGSIADLALYNERTLNGKVKERDNIIYTIKKKYTSRLGSIYILNIKNNSEVKIDIQDIKGVLGTSLEYNHELINGNKFTYEITPEEDVTMAIKILNQDKPDDILLTNKKMDGTIETFGIWKK